MSHETLVVKATLLKSTVSVFDVLAALDRPVGSTGTQQIFCPNPEHPERRPSARVYADSNHVHCFRCGTTWDPVDLVRVIQGLDFAGAIAWLSTRFGMPDLGTMAPAVVAQLLKAPDLAATVAHIEALIQAARGRLTPMQFHRCWLALDAATLIPNPETRQEAFDAILQELRA